MNDNRDRDDFVPEAPEPDLEDRVIEKILGGDPLTVPLGDSEEERALTREYIEVMGAIPRGLEPMEPAPELKERVISAIRAPRSPEGGPDGDGMPAVPFRKAAPAPAPARRPLALAASLALLLAGVAAYLGVELREARSEVGKLAAQVEELSSERRDGGALKGEGRPGGDFRPAAGSAEEEMRLARMLDDQAMLCKLWPPKDAPRMQDARGLLVIDAQGSGWAMEVAGLEPAPSGMAYRVWFLTDRGPVAAGTLTFDGARAQAGSGRVPTGARAVAVTLEDDMDAEAPAGDRVLYGEERMQLL